MRTSVAIRHRRNVLAVFPAYTPSFGTFAHAFPLLYNVRAFMPPQGLLLIAAYLPQSWTVRFVDENVAPATEADFTWADVVFASGMHIQASQIRDIQLRAHRAGKPVVLGGPSVSAAPELYPDADYLHVGEMGDATDALVSRLDMSVARPGQQVRLTTKERLPLSAFPIPAYGLANIGRYLIGSLQFSSGCPFQCEFCDIPALYGRQPRLKSPEQVVAELDALLMQPVRPHTIYFVDDNFIAHKKAARDLLPHLIAWQKRNGYPFHFACEATLNIARQDSILKMMREALFLSIFVGIETPDTAALAGINKAHNATLPMLDAIDTINSHGMEVTSGIIMGLDSDTPRSADQLIEFIAASHIPVLTMNLLQALPKTPLWDRLSQAGRITGDPSLESNVRFLMPYEQVLQAWRRCVAYAYAPENLFARYRHQVDHTYANRIRPPARGRLNVRNLRSGAVLSWRLFSRVGLGTDYGRAFWGAAKHALKRGQIDAAMGMGFVGHHLIQFAREAVRADQNASFYSTRTRDVSKRPSAAA
jgi:radical SAM superfamily enzyme YgiQ (UPF0313 family)